MIALAAAAAALTVGGIDLRPSDILDGRAIAGGTGAPVVMLTLTSAATARLKTQAVVLDGRVVAARIVQNTIEIDGQPSFEAASALALRLSGKPPLPDTTDE